MPAGGPGEFYRDGITKVELMRLFPDDETSEKWFVKCRWPDGHQMRPLQQRPG